MAGIKKNESFVGIAILGVMIYYATVHYDFIMYEFDVYGSAVGAKDGFFEGINGTLEYFEAIGKGHELGVGLISQSKYVFLRLLSKVLMLTSIGIIMIFMGLAVMGTIGGTCLIIIFIFIRVLHYFNICRCEV